MHPCSLPRVRGRNGEGQCGLCCAESECGEEIAPSLTLPRRRGREMPQGSVERLDLDDRGAVVVADPERARALGIVDVDTPNVGRVRQLIFGVLAALDIEA